MSQKVSCLKDIKLNNIQFEDVHREGNMYAVKFKEKLLIQTPPVVCRDSLVNSKGDLLPYLYVVPDPAFAEWLDAFDDHMLEQAHNHKDAWFRSHTTRTDIDQSFKRYFKDNVLRLKLSEGVMLVDSARKPVEARDIKPDSRIRVIMELSRILFGRTEFGCVWKAPQVMIHATKECLFVDTDEDDDVPQDEFL